MEIDQQTLEGLRISAESIGWDRGFREGVAHADRQGVISQIFDRLDNGEPLTSEQFAFAKKIGLTAVTDDMNPDS
jgi:hypothetical protein